MTPCPQCGANVARRDAHCSLCAADNPAYEPIPDETRQLMNRALSELETADYAEAIRLYEQIIERDPDIYEAYSRLIHCFGKLRLGIEAYKTMKRALEVRPGSATLHYNLGVTARLLLKKDEARAALNRALHLAETDATLANRDDFKRRVHEVLRRLPPS